MGKDPAFLFYTKDFQTGTQDMSCEELGAYLRLLMYQHQHAFIPNDRERMMRITGIFSVDKFEFVWNTLKKKFYLNGDHLVNQRLNHESTERSKSKPKKYAASVLAGLISSSKNIDDPTKFKIKKSFRLNDFLSFGEEEMNLKIRDWFSKMVNQMVNNLGNENGDANEDKNVDKEKGGMGEKENKLNMDFQEVARIFNEVCISLPKISKVSETRKTAIAARAKEHGLEKIGEVFTMVANSAFLNGENTNRWTADFDWILKPANFLKIIEGNYNSNGKSGKQQGIGNKGIQYSDDFKRKITDGFQSK